MNEPSVLPQAWFSVQPRENEIAIASLLSLRLETQWQIAAGSILTMPDSAARLSWQRWRNQHFTSKPRPASDNEGFDVPYRFLAEPFPGVKVLRTPLSGSGWELACLNLRAGKFKDLMASFVFPGKTWSTEAFLMNETESNAHRVVAGARRPVRGFICELPERKTDLCEGSWTIQLPDDPPPGPERGWMHRNKTMNQWPMKLAGIDWVPTPEREVPNAFVVGRAETKAWIQQARIDFDDNNMLIDLAWDPEEIDLLGCRIQYESRSNGATLIFQEYVLSDLFPHEAHPDKQETRFLGWNEKLLVVNFPRGPRRTDWGVTLIGPDGTILDRRSVATRVESFGLSLSTDAAANPDINIIAGDRKPPPTSEEHERELADARRGEDEVRSSAAKRRNSGVKALTKYMRWRFSTRSGELLILDPFLLATSSQASDAENKENMVVSLEFLKDLNRPIRALAARIGPIQLEALREFDEISVRQIPGRTRALHDRIWIVGESGLMVGTSINALSSTSARKKKTTVGALPAGDVTSWRNTFEDWWNRSLSGRALDR